MATDLPVLPVQKQSYSTLSFEHQQTPREVFNSAVTVRFSCDTGTVLPNVATAQTKRNSEGQVLQVKFAPEVTFAKFKLPVEHAQVEDTGERVPVVDSVLNVDHQHYEQWARVPGRRGPNSSLLRGIQALKARMKRESLEQELIEARNCQNKALHINTLTKNNLLTRDKLSDDVNGRRKERTASNFPKPNTDPRCPLKANAHVIDSDMFKKEEDADRQKSAEDKHDRSSPKEIPKPRFGMARIRDRCALPVSVYQPISIGDHVFLINEPVRYNEFLKLKSRSESKMKKEPKSAGKLQEMEPEVQQTNDVTESMERSKTLPVGFQSSKSGKRAPAVVSSAELFDFSRLSEIRHSMENKFIERSKTEFSFSGKTSKSFKLVPNVRRLKEGYKC